MRRARQSQAACGWRATAGISIALALAASAAHAAALKAVLLVPADDPRLERSRVERAAPGHPVGPVAEPVQAALKESAMTLDAAGVQLSVDTVEVADAAAARTAAANAAKAGAVALLTDLPADATLAVADAVKLAVLNIGTAADSLRAADCRRNLFHLGPSERMRMDAIAQTLVSRNWKNVLLLVRQHPLDEQRGNVAAASIQRYGLKLAGRKPFKLSADPRERDLANPALLTGTAGGGAPYDVVWVVDADGEFAVSLPYRTALPRPVVGDGGLAALAWTPKFERFGAPQVSRRIARSAGRPIAAHDWQAWLAGKALAAAAPAAAKARPAEAGAAFLKALDAVELDGSKGVAMSFRPWDGQLRQTVLLSDGQAVQGSAPVEGMLHPRNNLDTLGADAPEKLCKARQ